MLLESEMAERILREAVSRGGEFADLYVERRRSLTLSLEDGRLEKCTSGIDVGASIRVVHGRSISFVSTDSLDEQDLVAAARLAGEGAAAGCGEVKALAADGDVPVQPVKQDPAAAGVSSKVSLVEAAESAARSAGREVAQVSIDYGETTSEIQVADSDGRLTGDRRTRVRLTTRVVARRNGVIQTGYESAGALGGMELFDEFPPRQIGRLAAEKALVMLDSRPAPRGRMPVILHRGFGGVLFHEACGHGLEADAVEKGSSVYAGRVGEMVASELVTLIDDGSLAGEWGSGAIDDEGTPTRRNVLIEAGHLRGYMYDGVRARNAGVASTGNGRRQSFRHPPIPRMTNTFILAGDAEPDDVIAATERGFYAKTLSGGQVDPATGDFVFGVSEGYLVEGGRVTTPLRGATLVGNGPDALAKVDMVAGDFEMNIGICGKEGQGVPAGSGQPTLRVSEMTIGGTGE